MLSKSQIVVLLSLLSAISCAPILPTQSNELLAREAAPGFVIGSHHKREAEASPEPGFVIGSHHRREETEEPTTEIEVVESQEEEEEEACAEDDEECITTESEIEERGFVIGSHHKRGFVIGSHHKREPGFVIGSHHKRSVENTILEPVVVV